MVVDRIRAALQSDTPPEPEAHNELLPLLAAQNFQDIPAEDRFLIYNYLQKMILSFESVWNNPDRNLESSQMHAIFSDELNLLRRIAEATQYSHELYAWANLKRESLFHVLQQPPMTHRLAAWPQLAQQDREDLIHDIIKMQTEIYSTRACRFVTPPLAILDGADESDAALILLRNPDDIDVSRTPVSLNRKLLEEPSPQAAVLLAHHETLHHLTLQLAMALHKNELPAGHPLYEDAALRLARLKGGGTANAKITVIYNNDGEENFAYDQQGRLYHQLNARPAAAPAPASPSPF